jgi:hypothetical protein
MSNTITITLSFIYRNQNDRTNAVGLISSDIGKYAKQSDDSSYWELLDDSPVLWGALSSSTVDATDVTLSDIIVDDETKLSQTVVRIQNIPISPEVPADGYSLVYDGYTDAWQPKLMGPVIIASGTNVIVSGGNVFLGPYTRGVGQVVSCAMYVSDAVDANWDGSSSEVKYRLRREAAWPVNDFGAFIENNAVGSLTIEWVIWGLAP